MMLHCPNLNDTRSAGPLTEAELDATIASNCLGACTADACQQGRAPCPCPDDCRLPDDGAFAGYGLAACAISAVVTCWLVVLAVDAIAPYFKN